MNFVQRAAAAVLPAKAFAAVKAESQAWIAECPNCRHRRSVWDWGGIRWGSAGSPRRRLTCPACGETGFHAVAYRPQTASDPSG